MRVRLRSQDTVIAGVQLAITADMRKLVVMANALLRDNRKWSETRP